MTWGETGYGQAAGSEELLNESRCFALTSIEFLCKVNRQLKKLHRPVFRYRFDSSTKHLVFLRCEKREQEMPGVLPHSYSESIVPCA